MTYIPRYPGACAEKVSAETLEQIRERGCEAGTAAETEDTARLRRVWNEMEFLAHRLSQMRAKYEPPRCPDCGSDTFFDGSLIHYTDCKSG